MLGLIIVFSMYLELCVCFFFFFKQKTAYEMRISDWSSDVCSSDLRGDPGLSTHCSVDPLQEEGVVPLVVIDGNRDLSIDWRREIGRASCRERVCQYV